MQSVAKLIATLAAVSSGWFVVIEGENPIRYESKEVCESMAFMAVVLSGGTKWAECKFLDIP